MSKVEVKFSDWIQKGFDLYKANFVVLIVSMLIAQLLGGITLGILAGPLMAGVVLIALRLYDKSEPKPDIGDVFKGFDMFLNAFLFFLVWGFIGLLGTTLLSLVLCIGQLASILFIFSLQTFVMFGLFLIAEKRMEFWAASMASFNVVKQNFWPFLGLCVVASLIGSIGLIACGIGAILTAPLYVCILTVAYREVFSGGSPVIAAPTAASSVPPPPPAP